MIFTTNKVLVIIVSLFFIFLLVNSSSKNVEGLTDFNTCRGQGYSKEFCLTTPVANFGPDACQCADGSIGKIIPGFRGECVCDRLF